MKTGFFQSCGHCWVFQLCWHVECHTFTASSFRIWNSSTGIPSPPLAFLVVMLPKAHLTLHSRMSGSRWVITASWLSGLWRSFLYSSQPGSFQPGIKPKSPTLKADSLQAEPQGKPYMQSTSCEILGLMKHKLESRLPGETSITSNMQMTPPLWQKVKKN